MQTVCPMSIEHLNNLDDSRLLPYRALKDRELARDGERFLAEGEFIVRRLVASKFPTESVVLTHRRAEQLAGIAPDHVPIYILPDALVHQLIGFKFHSGVIACGKRLPSIGLDQLAAGKKSMTLVVCPETANAENLGSLIRISSAFSADGIILGEKCCDPFWRQAIRVSMGTVFSLPIVRSGDLLADLRQLREEHDFELIATVLDDSAESLHDVVRQMRTALLFGNEAQGLERHYVEACNRRVTIPMKAGVDSLNVAIAAAVFLFQFSRKQERADMNGRSGDAM
jgi:tRNA G18 (ribose-2'-O)-methylase SpoU